MSDPSVSTALRAIAIMEALAGARGALTLSEICAATQLAKPTAHRILQQLVDAGLLVREPQQRRFAPGPRLSALALRVLAGSTWNAPRHAILQALVQEVGETCNLTLLEGTEVVYLDRVEAEWPLRLSFGQGSRVPAHACASGKLLLALLPARERRRIVSSLPLPRFTETTVVEQTRLAAELVRIRRERCATDEGEYLSGTVCVAVPVEDGRRRVPAALAVHAPLTRMNLSQALQHVPALRRAAAQLAPTFAPA